MLFGFLHRVGNPVLISGLKNRLSPTEKPGVNLKLQGYTCSIRNLGVNRKSVNLLSSIRQSVRKLGGPFPEEYEEFLKKYNIVVNR